MQLLYFVLLLVAVLLFLAATVQMHASKVNLMALGLACAFAVPMIQMAQRL